MRQPHQLKPNLKKEEIKAIKQLKADKDRMVFSSDKGVALVVMDSSDYTKKAKEVLEDTNTYRTIQSDPTNKLKNKLINMLRKIKAGTLFLFINLVDFISISLGFNVQFNILRS